MELSDNLPPWLETRARGVALTVVITPGARATEIVGPYGVALKIRIAAPATDGKANALLLRYLSVKLGVRQTEIRVLFGHSARRKGVLILGVNPREVARSLAK
ncbi:MAG: DUF167 domain-containing protein [Actinobacteria bacterium]|nr:DUF167 domain-containing protein [Actinomycetota bacterium]